MLPAAAGTFDGFIAERVGQFGLDAERARRIPEKGVPERLVPGAMPGILRLMARCLFLAWFSALACTLSAPAADDLPTRSPGDVLDFEPALRLTEVGPEAAMAPAPVDVAAARAALERARARQARWQHLAKRGVLSQVEAESCTLTVAKALLKYENARVAAQELELVPLQKRVAAGELAPEAVQSAEAALASSRTISEEAATALKRTQLLLAENHVRRQRLLRAAGLGSRAQVQRAESALQQLQAGAR